MRSGTPAASLSGRLDFKTEQGFQLVPEVFGPTALENVTSLYVEGRTDLAQFEEDVEAILRVTAPSDPLDAL